MNKRQIARERLLNKAMRERGMTGVELAERIGSDPAVVSRYRNGLMPTPEVRRAISKALHVPQREIWPHA
jgi:transcriptional regulator with XRE-family HTH domain